MKVDGLAVVLAIILLPIILVVTYYIQLQVDTIAMENQYNTKLLSATYSAMSAFEMNTANEDLSSVADSMRSMILASNNIFFNTLATDLGMSNASKELLQPYVPAVLYTLYDGYYIYAPTEVPVVSEKENEENGLKVKSGYNFYGELKTENPGAGERKIQDSEIEGADKAIYGDILYESKEGASRPYTIYRENAKLKEEKDSYILKSYVQYSARYIRGNIDVTIDYTLDNYLNIAGKVDDVFYTKTGYLIDRSVVESAQIDGDSNVLVNWNEYDAKNKILGLKTEAEATTIPAANYAKVTVKGQPIESKFGEIASVLKGRYGVEIKTMSDAEVYLNKMYEEYYAGDSSLFDTINDLEYKIQNSKAVAYYISSKIFSDWVYNNLGELRYQNIHQIDSVEGYEFSSGVESEAKNLYYLFKDKDILIFDENENPEDKKSKFNTHKLEVIKNSIKYNLNLAISVYRNTMNSSYIFSMPVLEDDEWDKILSNISIVSFMQGWDCGLNIYNNYQIVSSTNNELMVTPSEIYYVESDKFNDSSSTYHRIDCPVWNAEWKDSVNNGKFINFKSKEVKYDKVYHNSSNSYIYDHRNVACYTCINTQNYKSFLNTSLTDYYQRMTSKHVDGTGGIGDEKRKAAYIGIAKERQDTYKTNALSVSQGYKVFDYYSSPENRNEFTATNIKASGNQSGGKRASKILITIAETKSYNTSGTKEPIVKFNVEVRDNAGDVYRTAEESEDAKKQKSAVLEQSKEQTIEIKLPNDNRKFLNFSVNLQKEAPGYEVGFKVKGIKVIYKD